MSKVSDERHWITCLGCGWIRSVNNNPPVTESGFCTTCGEPAEDPFDIAREDRAALEAVSSIHEAEPDARRGEQRTICAECGNSNLAHDRAVWTDDGSSFCPGCYPAPISKGVTVKALEWDQGEARSDGDLYSVHQLSQHVWQTRFNGTEVCRWRGTEKEAREEAELHRAYRLSHTAGEIEADKA